MNNISIFYNFEIFFNLGHEMKECTGSAKEKQGEVRCFKLFFTFKMLFILLDHFALLRC